jgi:penicillin-binding protein 1C
MAGVSRLLKGGMTRVRRLARSAALGGVSLLRSMRAPAGAPRANAGSELERAPWASASSRRAHGGAIAGGASSRSAFGRGLRATAAVLALACAGAVAWFFLPPDVPTFDGVRAHWRPSDAYLLDRHGEVIDQERMDFRVRRLEWTPLEAASPALIAAIVDGEDRRFWEHAGVDWAALLGAVRDNGVGQHRRGASTITMQVVALIDPNARAGTTSGAWHRKLAQIRMARALDAHWSKREILEAYLNLLGFRGELQGVRAASQVLAGKAPSGLTLSESLVLAALLPAPGASTARVAARACARATARHVALDCASIRATASDMLDAEETSISTVVTSSKEHAVENALDAPSTARRSGAVQLAPHLARTLLNKPGERVRTTLDAQIQRLALNTLRQHLTGLASRNVRDGAVLVVDNDTGDVLAYVGSAGPQSRAREVDGVRARRQAGSTLKPFLYEMALERHYLTAASLLNDAPITLDTASGIYLPQDYDRDFKGLVSVRTALGSSLNVPAVRALMLVGVEAFRDRLYSLGYTGITEPGQFYGYSLALGSAEVSLWEQVRAYRALARGGHWAAIQTQSPAMANDKSLLAPDAAFIVADMISDRAARVVTFGLDNYLNTPFWSAVKTGTSKDMRDNWCVGFSRRFTVGVWVGNFEGDSMHDVTGVTGAGPVWHAVMVGLHARVPSEPPATPQNVTATRTRFSPAVEPERTELFLKSAMKSVQVAGEIARISSPANGMVIAIDPDIPPRLQRVPLAARGADDRMVLRLNGQLVGPASDNLMWTPERGTYVLALEDPSGHTLDSARFIVR